MPMKKIIVLLILIFTVSIGFSTKFSDSLQNQIDILSGRKKIEAELELAYYFRRDDHSRAKELAENALNDIKINFNDDRELKTRAMYYLGLAYFNEREYQTGLDLFYRSVTMAQEDNNNFLLADLYYFIGQSHYFHYGDNSQAISYYNQSINYGLLSNNYRVLGAAYSSLSNLFRVSGSYEKSLEFIYNSKENYTKAGYREGIAWVEYTMGNLYNSVGLYEEAINAFNRSLKIYRELAADNNVMTGVAICLDQLCVVNTALNNLDLAKKYNKEAFQYYKIEDSFYGMSNSLKYRANIERLLKNYDKAETLLDSSLTLKKEINDKIGLSSLYNLYGALFIDIGDYQRALDSLFLGLKYAKLNNQVKSRIEIDHYIASAYNSLGMFELAYEFKARGFTVADSIFNSKTNRNMLQLETLYEIESKEDQINKLEQEKMITEISLERQKELKEYLFAIIALAIIAFVVIIFFFISKIRTNKTLVESKRLVEESNVMKDKFFSILAHDLRNPFNSILGLTRILKDRHRNMSDDEIDKITNSLFNSANNSYSLLNNLLEWSRTQRGVINFKPEPIQTNNLLREIIPLLQIDAEIKGIKIEYDDAPVSIVADKNMLHTVLRNLITNAVKYSNKGDTVKITVKQRQTDTLITVSDSGIGMSKENAAQLFTISNNYRLDGTEGEKGTGLGLMICKDFIDQHHGKIWVESESGKGSSFYFTIPKNISKIDK